MNKNQTFWRGRVEGRIYDHDFRGDFRKFSDDVYKYLSLAI